MIPVEQLRRLMELLGGGRGEVARVAELLARWSPEQHPPVVDYLAASGAFDEPGAATLPYDEPVAGPTDATQPHHAGVATASRAVAGGGRYTPLRTLTTGGLGQVWVARDEVLGREVALKVIRPDRLGIGDIAERFVREAKVTAGLEHPSIVPLYDFVEGGGAWGGPAYVMRLITGGTLAAAVARYHDRRAAGAATEFEFRTLLTAFTSVCNAIAYAHDRGVLHRDLKGQNVVLGAFGEVFLLDWGLTKLTPRSGDPDALAAFAAQQDTVEGVVSGTPAYIAPEVAEGEEASVRSDVYSLGAMLYAILTGKAPAEGKTPQDVLRKVRSADPPPPRVVNPAAAPALEAVCAKAMARDVDSRYQSAEELALEVRRWLADEPVEARREPWPDRAGRWAKRHRTGVGVAAATLVTATLALGVSTGLLAAEERKTRVQAIAAREGEERANANRDTAHNLVTEILRLTEEVLPPLDGSETKRLQLAATTGAALREFVRQRPDSAELARTAAQVTRVEANLRRITGDHAGAELAYRQSLAADATAGDGADPYHRPATLWDYANLLNTLGKPLDALDTLKSAEDLADAACARDPASVGWQRVQALLAEERARSELAAGQYPLADASAGRSVILFDKLLGVPPAERNVYDGLLKARTHGRRAMALLQQKMPVEARAETHAARDALKPYLTPNPGEAVTINGDDVMSVFMSIGWVETKISRTKGKDTDGKLAKKLGELARVYADLHTRHPFVSEYRDMLGQALSALGELREASGDAAGAAKLFGDAESHLQPLARDFPAVPRYRFDLGTARLGLGRVLTADEATKTKLRDQALGDLREACKSAPQVAEFRDALAAAGG